MHIDTDGTYTLQYTATDSCGNETIEEREVIVGTKRTARYADNTLIINELPKDFATNTAKHGNVVNIYPTFDSNGATDSEKYIFHYEDDQRPWKDVAKNILSVEFGESVAPTSTEIWFLNFNNCVSFDFALLDTSNINSMNHMFSGCYTVTTLALANFNTSSVTDMAFMFDSCRMLTDLDVSSFDTSNVTRMDRMFDNCRAIEAIDVSNFNTSAVTDMTRMFYTCSALKTIFASTSFVTTNVGASTLMFTSSSQLVGGAGTVFNSSHTNAIYARIDNPPDAPGYFTAKP